MLVNRTVKVGRRRKQLLVSITSGKRQFKGRRGPLTEEQDLDRLGLQRRLLAEQVNVLLAQPLLHKGKPSPSSDHPWRHDNDLMYKGR